MKLTLMLADSAQAVQGKLYILGGGWDTTMVDPNGFVPPSALAALIRVPWDLANAPHRATFRLLDADGQVVTADGEPVEMHNDFEAGRPPGTPAGADLPIPIVWSLGPRPMDLGRYTWSLTVDDEVIWSTEVAFTVRSHDPSFPGPAD
ncbi:MAG TPA: hypothetical protein VNQ73_11785 [Ilumatobacter sp.]|nr:hypothetical protein [Ilumatobacter sp.]